MPKKSAPKPSSRAALEETLLAPPRPLEAPVAAAAAAKRARGGDRGDRGDRGRSAAAAAVRGGDFDDAAAFEEEEDAALISPRQSRRVLDEARAQMAELAAEAAGGALGGTDAGGPKRRRLAAAAAAAASAAGAGAGAGSISATLRARGGAGAGVRVPALPRRAGGAARDSDDDEEDAEDDGGAGGDGDSEVDADDEVIHFGDEDDVERDGDYVGARVAGLDASRLASEEEIMRRFMPDAPGERRTLADTIMAKLRESEEAAAAAAAAAGEGSAGDGARAGAASRLDARVVEVYTEVGRFLSKYKSGKVPKVLKIVPGLSNWEEVLFLTNPETWTPHATYAATRIFSSSFNAAKAQRFVALILLPKCRDDIYFHKRLNFHLYLALQKATYKPAAFFKGVILPLAAARDCTLREAVIFGSVLAKASLPQLHSAAALVKLAAAPYSGAVSVFLRVLVNKKYTLPYLAVDAVAAHFAAFRDVAGPLPLVWHQALLTAAQRYKADFTADQKAALRDVLAAHGHHAIAPEVRRELASAGCRGEAPAAAPAAPAAAAAAAAAAPAAAQARAAATAAASGPAALILAGAAAGRGRGAMAVDY